MKKFITNLCTVAIVLNVFTHSGTTTAVAAEVSHSQNKQEIIADIFAQYSMTMEKAQGQVKALNEASQALKQNNISQDDLVAYAVADMKPSEAKAFLAKTAQMKNQTLSSEEAAKFVLEAQNQGSNFRACLMGGNMGTVMMFTGFTVGVVAAIIAITYLTENTKAERNEIKLERVAIEEEISILQGEGVADTSYLITSRRADIAYMNEQERQLEEQEADDHKTGMIAGGVAAASLVLALVNFDCMDY